MAMAASSNEGKSYADINVTPLIDVMLVLPIIFHHHDSEPDARN